MIRFCLTLDLKDDPTLIEHYISHHKKVWPEVVESLRVSGILTMEIYQVHTRLFMMLEVNDDFSFEKKSQADKLNSNVQEWEKLMDTYQQRLPFAKPDEKWVLMEKIFKV